MDCSVETPRCRQSEFLNGDLKFLTVFRTHGIFAFHGAHFGFQNNTARIFVGIVGFNDRLFADNTITANDQRFTIAVGNQPLASEELGTCFS